MDEAVRLCRQLNAAFKEIGWCVALGGGVLNRGRSHHDLDLVLVPFDDTTMDREAVDRLLNSLSGWVRTHWVEDMHASWRTRGLTDTKHVEAWLCEGRRVDFISPATKVS